MEECHIDLVRLAHFADARLIVGSANGIDPGRQEVRFVDGRPPLTYDILSINTGITPASADVPGADIHAIKVKPIAAFGENFLKLLHNAVAANDRAYRVAVVGGGPGGIELACAVQYRLTEERRKAGIHAATTVAIISRGPILSELSPYARRAMLPLLKQRAIEVWEAEGGAVRVGPSSIVLADGSEVASDACLWCTKAAAPAWLTECGIPTDANGFLVVNEYLQCDGEYGNIFAAGDCATSRTDPRPKAGVYAVRAVRSNNVVILN